MSGHNHAAFCCCHLEIDQGPCPGCPKHPACGAQQVWLVALPAGGLFGAYLDGDLAEQAAQDVGGVMVQLPIAADYRNELEAKLKRGVQNRVQSSPPV